MTINIHMEVILDTCEYMSKESTPSYYLKPLTTSLTLYLLIVS
jgi:hypothetical protein